MIIAEASKYTKESKIMAYADTLEVVLSTLKAEIGKYCDDFILWNVPTQVCVFGGDWVKIAAHFHVEESGAQNALDLRAQAIYQEGR